MPNMIGNKLLIATVACVALLSHGQVAQAALEAHWMFDEGMGSTVVDATGNGNDGTLINGVSWGAGRIGAAGGAFDGIDQYVNAGTLDVSGTAISLSAYFLSDNFDNCGVGGDCRILAKSSGTGSSDQYFMLSTINSDGATRVRFRLKTSGTTTTLIGSAASLDTGQWYHVVGVYDGSEMRLYQNGVEVGSVAKTGPITTNPALELWIGGSPTSATSRPWDGEIDDVRIYSQALTENEILALAAEQELLCENLLDDDSDSLVDCLDPDCSNELLCGFESLCHDFYDNDIDGDSDCADLDCDASEAPATFNVGFEDIPGLVPDDDIDAADFDSHGMQFDVSNDHSNFVLGEVFFLGEPLPYNDGGSWFALHGTFNTDPDPNNSGNPIGWEQPSVTMTLPSAHPFDLLQLDITETILGLSATSVHLTGMKSTGATVVFEVLLDGILDGTGPLNDWQTIAFDSSWTDLVSVTFEGEGEDDSEWALDNVVIARRGALPLCEASQELTCNDGFDNDGDGLADCDDPDCPDELACIPAVFIEPVPAISPGGLVLLGTLLAAAALLLVRRPRRG